MPIGQACFVPFGNEINYAYISTDCGRYSRRMDSKESAIYVTCGINIRMDKGCQGL